MNDDAIHVRHRVQKLARWKHNCIAVFC